jgi:DNA-binding transcriptional regulator YhcF (GntR family)
MGDTRMRPLGEVSLALLGAARELATEVRAPTLKELAEHAQVGMTVAEASVKNLNRHGHLQVPRTRRVHYRNRPVNEYAPVDHDATQGAGYVDLGQVISAAWR